MKRQDDFPGFTYITEAQFQFVGDEFQELNARHLLVQHYDVTFAMFAARPWYWRNFCTLLDAGGRRPLNAKQRAAAKKIYEQEVIERNGAPFQPIHKKHDALNRDQVAAHTRSHGHTDSIGR
jgi:hypothetical protein